jgi:hypothetical protein
MGRIGLGADPRGQRTIHNELLLDTAGTISAGNTDHKRLGLQKVVNDCAASAARVLWLSGIKDRSRS